MTTVIADSRVGLMGADTFCSTGVGGYRASKIFRSKRGLFGCAGEDTSIAKFESYILRGGKKPLVLEEFEALQMLRGNIYIWGEAVRPELILGAYHAIGTGGVAAGAALRHGASVREALETAEYFDANTKGPYSFLEV